MIEKLIDFNIDNIWNYLIVAILSIGLLFLTQYVKIQFRYQEMKKRKDYFLQFLRYNETIDECINKVKEKSELKTSQTRAVLFLALMLGYLGSVFLFLIIILIAKDLWLSVSILALINILPFILVIIYINLAINNPLENTNLTFKGFEIIKYFILFSNFVILIIIRSSYLSQSEIELISVILFIISFAFLLGTAYGLIKGKAKVIFALKSSLNDLYLDKFPNICIKVINEDICGKITNIFDENLIILYHNGQKIAVEWDKIIIISLKEKIIQSELDV